MENSYLTEAFKSLQILEEEDFNLADSEDIEKIKDFANADEKTEFIDIIDPEAENEEELEDSYVGKVICDCEVCHSKIYKEPTEIIIDEESQLANIGEECPYCYSSDGFKIVGQIAPFNGEVEEPEKDAEVDDIDVEKELDKEEEKEDEEKDEVKESLTEEKCPECGKEIDKEHPMCDKCKEKAEEKEEVEESCAKKEDLGGSLSGGLIGGAAGAALGGPVGAIIGGTAGANIGNVTSDNMHPIKTAVSDVKDTVNLITEGEENLPELCYVDTITDGVGVVKRGESGYYQTDIAQSNGLDLNEHDKIEELVDMLNDRLGVSKEEAEAMKIGSMFGWDVPGAKAGAFKKEDSNKKPMSKDESLTEEVHIDATGEDRVNIDKNDDGSMEIHVGGDKPEGEEIVPLEPEMKNEIEANSDEQQRPEEEPEEIEYNLDDFDEDSFDGLGESYLKKVYENVNSFKTTKVSKDGNKLKLEGLINFKSGKNKKTSFVFEAKNADKNGKVKFLGENLQISRGKKSFTLKGTMNESKFVAESLTYNYMAKNSDNKSVRLYGTIKK